MKTTDKLLFIGDMHADTTTPISRKDSYRDTFIEKVESLLNYCIDNNITHVFTTGDTFHKTDQSIIFLNEFMAVLTKFKDKDIKFYSAVGNHDLPNNSFGRFKNSPLYLLFQAGLMLPIPNPLELDNNVVVYGLDFTKDIPKVVDTSKTNILVMHYATDNMVPNESIPRKDLHEFAIVVAGHDHHPYELLKEKPLVLRMGSFTRLTKEQYNLDRKIKMYEIDTSTLELKLVDLPNVKPAEEVFRNFVFTDTDTFAESLDYSNIFKENFFKKETANVYEIVDNLPVSVLPETKAEIRDYLKTVITNETE